MVHLKKSRFYFFKVHALHFFWIVLGSFLAALALRVFFIPHQLIDGGVVGVALILARFFGESQLSFFLIVLNIPFLYLAYKNIRKTFVFYMLFAVIVFSIFLFFLQRFPPFATDVLEAIVFGGGLLGIGVGLIIRNGGCTDGTEILAIIINRKKGFTVGQTILFINIFIFAGYGWLFGNWHSALRSLMAYVVAFKMMDFVIAGLDELKSVMIVTVRPKKIREMIAQQLGLGFTLIPGVGGFSGENRELIYIIVERLDLSDLKEIVLREDPTAFMAIENLHEVVYGRQGSSRLKKNFKKPPLLAKNI